MYYKIKSIKHSGRKGERYTDRTDGRYSQRVGRIVEIEEGRLDKKYFIKGVPMIFHYIKDYGGNDYSHKCYITSDVMKYLVTSNVMSVDTIFNDLGLSTVILETINSIYELEEVEVEK